MALVLIFLLLIYPSTSFSSTLTLASRGWCCSNLVGSNCCADNDDEGAMNCDDGTPYCANDGQCTDTGGDYSVCALAGTGSDYYANGDVPPTNDIFDVNFVNPCIDTSQLVIQRGAGLFQTAVVGMFRLDTSEVPDNHTITDATLQIYVAFIQQTGTDHLHLNCDYSDWNAGVAGCGEDDFTVSGGVGSAFSILIDDLLPGLGTVVSIPVSLGGISKTGYTYFKCMIESPGDNHTDGTNQVQINIDDATHPGPRLLITSTVLDGCCDCEEAEQCAEPIGEFTCPFGCIFTPNAVCDEAP